MKPKYIWLVTGSTGEYSDRYDWNVCAYDNEQDAKDHAKAAEDWYNENGGVNQLRGVEGRNRNPYDPYMYVDYTGTSWSIDCVTFNSRFKKSKAK